MAYKVAIDTQNGSSSLLNLSKFISNELSKIGIDNFLVRKDSNISNEERVNLIKNKYGNGNNVIVISNRSNNGSIIDIIYPLRSNSKLASSIASNLQNTVNNEIRYYQLRNSSNTALDDDYLIRNTPNNQTIIIDYGNTNLSNYEPIGRQVVKSIANYVGATYNPDLGDGYYTVKKGDTLWSIANKNNITVNELKTINNLKTNTLQIGQILKLNKTSNSPSTTSNEVRYTVQKGDSLWAIANKYNTTVDKIKTTNNLSSNLLQIGQVLIIPSSTNYLQYIVKKGDSLWLIAKNYNSTVDKIRKINNLTTDVLQIGQQLLVEQ